MADQDPLTCEYTLRELQYIALVKQNMKWEHTSHIMWSIAAVNGSKKKAHEFNPYYGKI